MEPFEAHDDTIQCLRAVAQIRVPAHVSEPAVARALAAASAAPRRRLRNRILFWTAAAAAILLVIAVLLPSLSISRQPAYRAELRAALAAVDIHPGRITLVLQETAPGTVPTNNPYSTRILLTPTRHVATTVILKWSEVLEGWSIDTTAGVISRYNPAQHVITRSPLTPVDRILYDRTVDLTNLPAIKELLAGRVTYADTHGPVTTYQLTVPSGTMMVFCDRRTGQLSGLHAVSKNGTKTTYNFTYEDPLPNDLYAAGVPHDINLLDSPTKH